MQNKQLVIAILNSNMHINCISAPNDEVEVYIVEDEEGVQLAKMRVEPNKCYSIIAYDLDTIHDLLGA